MNKLISRFMGLLLLYGAGAAAYAESSLSNDSPLKIGAILTLSGNFAAAGEDSRRGIEAALATEKNSDRLEFQFEDSRNEPSVAISDFQKLITIDQVAAIYTHRSSIGMALNPISLKSKIPLLGAVGHQDFEFNNQFAFQVWPKADDEGAFLANELKRRNYKRIAVLYTEDEWTNSVTRGFRSRLKELGGKLVFDQAVLPGEQDFRTQLLKLKSLSPDALYLNVLLPQIAPMLKQSRVLNLPGTFFGNFYMGKKEVRDAVNPTMLKDVCYIELDNNLPNLKRLLGRDEPPPGLAVASFVSTLLLLQASNDSPQPKNPAELMGAISRQKEVRTPDGTYLIRGRHIQFPLAVKVMRNGKWVAEGKAG